jgi:NAD-dependent dihydropyrimidine dehydrogenase PreA subunit
VRAYGYPAKRVRTDGRGGEEKGKSMAQEMDRRLFLGTMGTLGAAGMISAGMTALAEESASSSDSKDSSSQGGTLANTPADLEAKGGTYLSLAQANDLRHQLVDGLGDFTKSDGTVVPAVWNKLRALIYSIGLGCGDAPADDDSFDFFQRLFTEDEAQAYLEMPYGVLFTAADFAEVSGRDEQDCLDLCEDLATRGLLWRARRAGTAFFHQVAVVHGMFEYNWPSYYGEEGWIDDFVKSYLTPMYASQGMLTGGTPFYYAIPCDESVVGDEQILVGDDYRKIVARNEYIAVAPCQCRLMAMKLNGVDEPPAMGTDELKDYHTPVCGHPLETCMIFGEEAQYYIERGAARQIDQEEALSIMERSVEEGMILQSCFTRGSEIICSCHGDCCGILSGYLAAGVDACADANSYPNNSHYNLEYDKDACIQCGACVERCPMFAITMDETNHPVVNATCMRCGQCGLVCPVGARKLVAKDPSEYIELPADLLDDYNLNAEFRFDHGMVH